MRSTTSLVWVGAGALSLALVSATPASAVNRFRVESASLPLATQGHVISVLADLDQDTFGLSVSIEFDRTRLLVSKVELGADALAVDPEFKDGYWDNTTGRVSWGVVFDGFVGTGITKHMSPGTDLEILRLTVDVSGSFATTTTLDLVNRVAVPARLNVMTNAIGDSIDPAPQLVDGSIQLIDLRPRIVTILGGSGTPESTFWIDGANFDKPNRTVTVGGRIAEHTLLDSDTLQVTAPLCATGVHPVEVCTDFGCDSRADGFTCEGPPIPQITGFLSNTGVAGNQFWVQGKNFDQSGLRVEVCGTEAEATPIGSTTIQVQAPACGSEGWARVQVYTDIGDDFRDEGFFYEEASLDGTPFVRGDANHDDLHEVDLSDAVAIFFDLYVGTPSPAPCRDALDADDSGEVDLSDGIYVLDYLYKGGPIIPEPYPDAGLDETADTIPGSPSCDPSP